jgi:hypothetical protein
VIHEQPLLDLRQLKFNSDTIGIINAPETIIVAFFLLKGDFERRELLGTTFGKGVF